MTVIACRDGVIAADSGRWHSELCFGLCEKIFEVGDGFLAAAGSEPMIFALVKYLREGGEKPDIPSDEDGVAAIWLRPRGVFTAYDSAEFVPEPSPFIAAGSHTEFLMGAMAAGASAEEAVGLALEHCAFARGPMMVRRV